jgi:putative NADH-flavin reductase
MSKPRPKTIAVVGANGRSGRLFVNAALAAGYDVRAGVHNGGLEPTDRLKIMKVDATKPTQVASLISGSDAVVSLIGHVKGSPNRVQTEAMQVLVDAMRTVQVHRLISLTGTGVRIPGDTPSLLDYVLNFAIKLIDPQRIQDGIDHAELLQDSGVDWTILRVLKLSNGSSKPFKLTSGGPAKLFTSREEVAEAILEVVRDDSYIHTTPIISR